MILMPTDLLFVWLHIELNLYFVFFNFDICDHELYKEYPFKDIKMNFI